MVSLYNGTCYIIQNCPVSCHGTLTGEAAVIHWMNEIQVDFYLICVRIGCIEAIIVKESSHMRTELYTITVQLITGLHCLSLWPSGQSTRLKICEGPADLSSNPKGFMDGLWMVQDCRS